MDAGKIAQANLTGYASTTSKHRVKGDDGGSLLSGDNLVEVSLFHRDRHTHADGYDKKEGYSQPEGPGKADSYGCPSLDGGGPK